MLVVMTGRGSGSLTPPQGGNAPTPFCTPPPLLKSRLPAYRSVLNVVFVARGFLLVEIFSRHFQEALLLVDRNDKPVFKPSHWSEVT